MPRYATAATSVTYFSGTLFRKKLVSASAAKAANNARSTAWPLTICCHVSTGSSVFFEIPGIVAGRCGVRVRGQRLREPGDSARSARTNHGAEEPARRCLISMAQAGGASSCVAIRRALIRMARAALVMVIVALDTASMSAPTRNGSRMLLPLNCAANSGRSTEKSPYGSLCAATTTPVRTPLVSMPTRILIGPS